jgi:hypothetical protein
MAAVMDVVLHCGVCRQEYFLLDDYYKHQCADNNNNVSGKCFYFKPDFDSFFSSDPLLIFPALWFSNRFDLALMIFKIK